MARYFEKISFEQFKKDYINIFGCIPTGFYEMWENIKLPKRATVGSAGYDFFTPIEFELSPNKTILLPTGIRCNIDTGYALKLYPRSGFGFKYKLRLNNTIGVIDEDYYYSDNEGHIMVKITNETNENKTIYVSNGCAFMQGILEQYFITYDDSVTEVRNGGFGSTGK